MSLRSRQEKYDFFSKFFTLNPINVYTEKKGKDKGKKKCAGEHNGPLVNIEETKPLRKYTNFGCLMNDKFFGLDLDSHDGKQDEGVLSLLNDCKFDIKKFIDDNMEQLIVTTTPNNGLHVFFAHNERSRELLPKNLKNVIPGVDIVPQLFEGGQASTDKKKKGDEFVYEIIRECEPDDMIEMPDELLDKLHMYTQQKMEKRAHVAKMNGTNKDAFEVNIDKVRALLSIIPTFYTEDNTQWKKVGMCLKHIIVDDSVGYKLFDEFSKRATNGSYTPSDNKHKWEFWKKAYGYTISCLKAMASYEDDNLEAYEAWKEMYEINTVEQEMGQLLHTELSEVDISDFWLSIHRNNFKVYNKITYSFVNGRWKQSNGETLINEIKKIKNDLYNFYFDVFKPKFSENETIEVAKWLENIYKKLLKLGQASTIKNIAFLVINEITVFEDIFDNNIDLLGFDNGVYDLKNMEFRKARYNDYVTMSVGYDYGESNEEDVKTMKKFLKQIMPIKAERDTLMTVLASCLSGHLNENIHFLLGCGRNGKDTLITTIMFNLLGKQYTRNKPTDSKVLTKEANHGSNVEVASLNKVRLNVFSEPPKDLKIKCDMIKLLTGSNTTSGRMNYSNNTDVSLHAKHFIMQNELLGLDNPDEATMWRIMVYLFPSSFLSQASYDACTDKTNKYLGSPKYKSDEFIKFMKLPMLSILLTFYKKYQDNGYQFVDVPKEITERANKYIEDSNSLYGWFYENYEACETDKNGICKDKNCKEFLSLKDLKDDFCRSDCYKAQTKIKMSYFSKLSKFKDEILKIEKLNDKFSAEKRMFNKVNYRSTFIHFKQIVNESDEIV